MTVKISSVRYILVDFYHSVNEHKLIVPYKIANCLNIIVAPIQEHLVYNGVAPEIIRSFGSNNTFIGTLYFWPV